MRKVNNPEHTPELGRWIGPGTAEVSGPSSLDYEDADFPITGAVTPPLRDCGNCAGAGCAECHGSGRDDFRQVKAAGPVPCGGCGAEHPNERCLGCRHDFQVLGAWDGKEQAHA